MEASPEALSGVQDCDSDVFLRAAPSPTVKWMLPFSPLRKLITVSDLSTPLKVPVTCRFPPVLRAPGSCSSLSWQS